MTQGKKIDDGQTIIIKKYANRRLYNTRSSSYITLDHLSKMTREGVEFKVVDAKTDADITHQILTQIIMEEEASGEQMLPVSFLRQLISMYGNSMQTLLPQYLEASMEQFRDNQIKLRKAFEDSMGNNPLAQLAQRNMDMFRTATEALVKSGFAKANEVADAAEAVVEETAGVAKSEIEVLREQMAAMQKRLDTLGK